MNHGEIPVEDVRRWFLDSGLTQDVLAEKLGIDQAAVSRTVGAKPVRGSVRYKTAVRYARAMDLDPVEVGL